MALKCPILVMACLSACFSSVSTVHGQVVKDQHGLGIVDRGIVIPSFNREQVTRTAKEFVRETAKGTSIARLLIAPDKERLYENYSHGTPHNTYKSTIEPIERGGMPKGPMVRVLSIGGHAKISYLENGKLMEETLSSSDPTITPQGAYSYELLHFNLTQSHLRGDPYFLTLYLKASPNVSINSCFRIYEMLQQLTQIEDLTIEVRSDPWFIETYRYPAVLAFTMPLEIPSFAQYVSAPSVTCGFVDRKIICSGRNFAP